MQSYQPNWAARGHLLARSSANAHAYEAFTVAIGLPAMLLYELMWEDSAFLDAAGSAAAVGSRRTSMRGPGAS